MKHPSKGRGSERTWNPFNAQAAHRRRSVVPVEFEDVDIWLHGTLQQASAGLRVER